MTYCKKGYDPRLEFPLGYTEVYMHKMFDNADVRAGSIRVLTASEGVDQYYVVAVNLFAGAFRGFELQKRRQTIIQDLDNDGVMVSTCKDHSVDNTDWHEFNDKEQAYAHLQEVVGHLSTTYHMYVGQCYSGAYKDKFNKASHIFAFVKEQDPAPSFNNYTDNDSYEDCIEEKNKDPEEEQIEPDFSVLDKMFDSDSKISNQPIEKKTKWIFVTFAREGIHCYPEAGQLKELADVSYLQYPHRHQFRFRVDIEVGGDNREIEFIQFQHFCTNQFDDGILELNNKSCEMIADDLCQKIKQAYPNRAIKIEVSEDGENGAVVEDGC